MMHTNTPDNPSAATGLVTAVLTAHAPPGQPRDGDCLTVAPRVTDALRTAGLVDAATITVWAVTAADVILAGHVVTCWRGWVADATARQFHPALPAAWWVPLPDYLRRLATAIPGAQHCWADTPLPAR